MTKLQVLTYPNPKLFETAEEVEIIDGVVPMNIEKLIEDMCETMYAENGVGLAAPQVGVLKRVIVLDVSLTKDETGERVRAPIAMINPVVVEKSKKIVAGLEGCLSIPGYYDYVDRSKSIRVKAYTKEGKPSETEASDVLARGILHEVDHLDGKIYLDRLSRLKKEILAKKIRKHGGVVTFL